MTIQEYLNTEPLTNRKRLIAALLDKDGENEGTFRRISECMNCLYIGVDSGGRCEGLDYRKVTNKMCFECKQEWLDKEIRD